MSQNEKTKGFEIDRLKLFESQRASIEQHNQDLRARAKSQDELTHQILCSVESTHNETRPITRDLTPPVYGPGGKPQGVTGFYAEFRINIQSDTPVKTLIYRGGFPAIQSGDTIRAHVITGERVSEKHPHPNISYIHVQTHLVERDWQKQEVPIKIEKLRGGKPVDTYVQQAPI